MTDLFKPMTLEDQAAMQKITDRINNPMKQYCMEYYHYNPRTDIYELHSILLDSKQFAEFIIETAFSKDYRVREVKELW